MARFPVGKRRPELLKELLDRYAHFDPRLILGPRIGEDAAVIDFGETYVVAKTDPITFAVDEIGWYAVHVNANDVACCGAIPRWFLATILLPQQDADKLAETIFSQIDAACRELHVSLCGGHTEITFGLPRPIVVGQMLGEVAPHAHLTTSGARIGDTLILTKGIAVEGTAIIAREKHQLLQGVFSATELDRCRNFLREPGISVVPEARLAIEVGGIHALHDPTEGGLITGLWELAEAAGVGVVVDEVKVPVLPECRTICEHLGLNPWGLIASGALLISADSQRAATVVERLGSAGILAASIGHVVPPEQGCHLRSAEATLKSLPRLDRDELARLFD